MLRILLELLISIRDQDNIVKSNEGDSPMKKEVKWQQSVDQEAQVSNDGPLEPKAENEIKQESSEAGAIKRQESLQRRESGGGGSAIEAAGNQTGTAKKKKKKKEEVLMYASKIISIIVLQSKLQLSLTSMFA